MTFLNTHNSESKNTAKILSLLTMALILTAITLCGCAGPTSSRPSVNPWNASPTTQQGKFTIVLAQYSQFDRVMMAQALQIRAKKILNSDDVWLLNDPQWLSVNFGRFDDIKTADRQIKRVRKLYPSLNAGQLQFCFVKEIPQPDPPAPNKWNLLNTRCYASLDIATYYDVPEDNYFNRKADAVRGVETLRKAGETAFYIHGQFESRVYVSCLPPIVVQNYTPKTHPSQFHPTLKGLIQRHPFRYENGDKVYDIVHDQTGNAIKIPRIPVPVIVDDIRQEITF